MSGAALPILYVALDQHTPQRVEAGVANYSLETPAGFTSLARRFDVVQAPLRWFAATFALLALTATGLGVFALATAMSEMVALRRRDIAIRLAVGAEPRHIVAWIIGKALTITGAGVFVGLSLARWLGDIMSRHLSASVVGDLYLLAQLSLAFGVVGILASWRPARRASRVQPSAVFADPTA
jgi:ABC-type antimicrobial peptide transport system permease subunit